MSTEEKKEVRIGEVEEKRNEEKEEEEDSELNFKFEAYTRYVQYVQYAQHVQLFYSLYRTCYQFNIFKSVFYHFAVLYIVFDFRSDMNILFYFFFELNLNDIINNHLVSLCLQYLYGHFVDCALV